MNLIAYYSTNNMQATSIHMQKRSSESIQAEIKTEVADKSNNSATSTSIPIIKDFPIAELHDLTLKMISGYIPSIDAARFIATARNSRIYTFFQPEIGKKEAVEAAACAIYPVEKGENNAGVYNVTKLKALLKACPALLLHPVSVKNRHSKVIQGTVYQIALHENDNELVDDVIEPAFKRLNDGLETMEAQRQAWLPEGWLEAETVACNSAMTAIDNLFAALKKASDPNDVTELPQPPWTITIHHQEASLALEAFRKAIDALYQATDKAATSGRDPMARLLEYFIDRYIENFEILGGYNSPRNNVLMRSGYGYKQRYAPINFMQAFTMGIYSLVKENKKLERKFEYSGWSVHFILPLDSVPTARLGYEYFAEAGAPGLVDGWRGGGITKLFVNQKQRLYKSPLMLAQSETLSRLK